MFATGGDGFTAVFARALDASGAAVAPQVAMAAARWPEPVLLGVRMGLHTGEAEERDGDYFGSVVNRKARLMALAEGGHGVMSRTTADIVRGQLPAEFALVDVGVHELRSFRSPEHV